MNCFLSKSKLKCAHFYNTTQPVLAHSLHTRTRACTHTVQVYWMGPWEQWNAVAKRWVLRFVLKEAREEDWQITDGSEFQTVGA